MSTLTLSQLRTPRLACERLRPDHLEALCTLLRDPRVARTTWAKTEPPTEAEVASLLSAKVAHWDRHGFGLWLLRDPDSGEMIGRGGLQYTHATGPREVEAGWAIVPERWGQGLATELAAASLEVGFDLLGLREIIAFALPHNIASRRVMEKTGFVYERDFEHAGLPHVLYRKR